MLTLPLLYKIVSVLRHEDSFIPIDNLKMCYNINPENYTNLLIEVSKANNIDYEYVDILNLEILGVKFEIKPNEK